MKFPEILFTLKIIFAYESLSFELTLKVRVTTIDAPGHF